MQIPGLEWLEQQVRGIPGALVDTVKRDVEHAASNLWDDIRRAAANAINNMGAAVTSSVAGTVAPSGSQPVTLPLSSGQVQLVALALLVLVVLSLMFVFRRR